MKTLLLWAILAQSADLSTTLYGLHHGCREIVWPTQHATPIATTKIAATIIFTWGAPRLHRRHPRLTTWVAGTMIVNGFAGAGYNLTQIGHCQ